MRIVRRFSSFSLALLLMAACSSGPPDVVEQQLGQESSALFFKPGVVRVMTRNMYVGTDLSQVLGATDPSQIPVLAAQAFATLQASDVPGRMEALADEIAATRPDLVGLQEDSVIRINGAVVVDFVALLQAYLQAEGQSYRVAAQSQNFDVQAPLANPDGSLSYVRLTDYDVILARSNVDTSNVVTKNYAVSFSAQGFQIKRGYEMVDATVRGETVKVSNTHLESFVPQVRWAQAQELAQTLAAVPGPVIALGDYNSIAPNGTAYQILLGSGLRDGWATGLHFGKGFTCCQDPDLRNAESKLDQRIDLVLLHNSPRSRVLAVTVGDQPWQKTDSGLWPSDHAAVAAAVIH